VYEVTVRARGYVTYHLRHSIQNDGRIIDIGLVEDVRNADGTPAEGTLSIETSDYISREGVSNFGVMLFTYTENSSGVFERHEFSHTSNAVGIIEVSLPRGYYYPAGEIGGVMSGPLPWRVVAGRTQNARYHTFGLIENTEFLNFHVTMLRQGGAFDFGYSRLDLLTQDGIIAGRRVAMNDYSIGSSQFDYTTELNFFSSALSHRGLRMGFYLNQNQVNAINEFTDNEFMLKMSVSVRGVPTSVHTNFIVVTASDMKVLMNGKSMNEGRIFIEVAEVVFCTEANSTVVKSDFWMPNLEED
jgi:hypothetical protein